MSYSIIIPTWRRTALLEETLLKILQLTNYSDVEIIVHIDANDNETANFLDLNFPNIRYISSDVSVGPGGGRNKLMNLVKHDWVFSFDDDSYPLNSNFFGQALARAKKVNAALVTFQVQHLDEVEPSILDSMELVCGFIGCAALYNKKAFLETHGYIPIQWAYGVEEEDLSLQLIDKGYKLYRDNMFVVFHNTNLSHHKISAINCANIANRLVLMVVRFPIIAWPLGLLMFLNRVFWAVKNERWKGLLQGIFTAPIKAVTYSQYRNKVSMNTIKKWRSLRS